MVDDTVTWSSNWLSGIDDDAPISEISIPGTHDTGARYGDGYQCQWFSIIQQLNLGIRFLDIRCNFKVAAVTGLRKQLYFPIYHGEAEQYILFEEVQAQCISFLQANPSEFILMNVQMNEEGNGDAFGQTFLRLTAPYLEKYWYLGDGLVRNDDGQLISEIPTKKQCAGRIVLIRGFDPKSKVSWDKPVSSTAPDDDRLSGFGLEWNGIGTNGESENLIFKTQNNWSQTTLSAKADLVRLYLREADKWATDRPSHIVINFASMAEVDTQERIAAVINPQLQAFVRSLDIHRVLGIIPIDFIGNTGFDDNSLENLIISHQIHQKDGFSYGGLAPWLLRL